jgi:hypothetical protein
MMATRPPYQLELALPMPGRGEAPRLDLQEVEAVTAMAERKPGIHRASHGGDL